MEIYQGVYPLLEKLKEDSYRLFVGTSKYEVYAKKILDKFSLSKYFDFVAGADLYETRSNKIDVLKYLLEENSIKNFESIMIGDRKSDIKAANDLKMKAIGVTYGYGSLDEFEKAEAVANEAFEIYNLVKKIKE